ncbi:PREDICTED: LRR receptor-like serine/threonine-protein kinase GSO1 [Fragaria vesca subsp. vesca]|uniref:LRR receptor-like serine/threonine-protein kinase GSO1 n=1 Tax=Fragaria vesca subsp. vesca TaxID=101020 RepID=UPI0002C3124F|nr:PREDICTED: LRR receptor-like serine/threonine-protein kinase GSO1 [Fragaria vesca subsp. vesca]
MGSSMRAVLLLRFLTFATIASSIGSCIGNLVVPACRESEKQALLIFKQDLTDPSNRLSTWVSEEDSDCCRWAGVVCDNSTGHIHELHLDSDWGDSNAFGGKLNPSLLNLTHLTRLNLRYNDFQGTQIPSFFGSLESLTHLDLSQASFGGMIPESLSGLNYLESLILMGNDFGGEVPESLGNLCNLIELDLSVNNFNGNGSEFLERLAACSSHHIESLRLNSNNFSGHLTSQIGNITSLSLLDLGYNQFDGVLPESIGQLKRLTQLVIHHNSFQGVVSEVHFTHLTRLEQFEARGNSLTLETPRDWIPPFQLRGMFLDYWHLAPEFPMWLQTQRQLDFLSLSSTGISGTIPNWFWNSSSQLSYLNLSNNHLHGNIENISAEGLAVVDLSSNQFQGSLPLVSSTLDILDLSNSSFSGSVFHFFCDKIPHQLTRLYIGNNLLTGKIPDCFRNWEELVVLELENNNLSGNIPSSIGNLVWLRLLNLRNNNLSGELPLSMQNCSDLIVADLRGNALVGSLPSWIGKCLLKLKILNLRLNNLRGAIPDELCNLKDLQILDLAHNNISGTLPRCFNNFSAMVDSSDLNGVVVPFEFAYGSVLQRNIDIMFLVTKGREAEYGNILGLLTSMDLSANTISGEIPEEITSLISLQNLNVSGNLLTGRIPSKIGYMGRLESLDLSMNKLSGEIPASMTRMTFLSHLNLSHNNLTGRIPESTQLQSLDQSGFLGNELCGAPLIKNCSASNVIPPTLEQERGYDLLEDKWFYLSLGLGFLVGFWGIFGSLLVNLPWSSIFARLLNSIVIKLHAVIV